MKLAIFGATGRTGRHLLRQAIEAGFEVVTLVRTPGKLPLRHERLTVIQGDIQEEAVVDRVIQGVDAVVSVLGPVGNTPSLTIAKGTSHIVKSMKTYGVRRLVISAGAGVGDPNDAPTLVDRGVRSLIKLVARHAYEDMRQAVEVVRGSDVEWTIIRAPMLTDGPKQGKIRVGYVGKNSGIRLTRADLAEYLLKQVNDRTHLHQSPVVSN